MRKIANSVGSSVPFDAKTSASILAVLVAPPDGETVSHTLAHVLTGAIDFEKLPKETSTARFK